MVADHIKVGWIHDSHTTILPNRFSSTTNMLSASPVSFSPEGCSYCSERDSLISFSVSAFGSPITLSIVPTCTKVRIVRCDAIPLKWLCKIQYATRNQNMCNSQWLPREVKLGDALLGDHQQHRKHYPPQSETYISEEKSLFDESHAQATMYGGKKKTNNFSA